MPEIADLADFRFGRFELRIAAQRLFADGEPVVLGPRAFDLLAVLVERAGQLVSKSELLDRVWAGLVVEENNLQVQVSALRKALGAEAIATVAGRGYRFELPVQRLSPPPTAAAPAAVAPEGAGSPSIAVLPFVNLSDDTANEYFADGLSEELINILSRIGGLRVASRTSAFSFKGARLDLPTIGQRLKVATILEGSVRKTGTRIRVTAQLVAVATDSHLWSETYDRELEDIFVVQDDIAHRVVGQARAALLGEPPSAADSAAVAAQIRAAVKGRCGDPEAYRQYLQGAYFLNRYNGADIEKAIGHLRRALELEPGYAKAWAALSFCHLHQGANAWVPFEEAAGRARDAARRALDADPDQPGGHWAMGAVLMYHDWDWRGAEASLRRALKLAPEDPQLLLAAKLMHNLGQAAEAEDLLRQVLARDPLNVEAYLTFGLLALGDGRLAEAEDAFREALELGPNQRERIHFALGRVHLEQGRLADALREVAQEVHEPFRLLGLGLVHHAGGRPDAAADALRDLRDAYGGAAAYQVAELHAFRGEIDLAFQWLERARRQRDPGIAATKVDPLLASLHGDPRWVPWLTTMGLAA